MATFLTPKIIDGFGIRWQVWFLLAVFPFVSSKTTTTTPGPTNMEIGENEKQDVKNNKFDPFDFMDRFSFSDSRSLSKEPRPHFEFESSRPRRPWEPLQVPGSFKLNPNDMMRSPAGPQSLIKFLYYFWLPYHKRNTPDGNFQSFDLDNKIEEEPFKQTMLDTEQIDPLARLSLIKDKLRNGMESGVADIHFNMDKDLNQNNLDSMNWTKTSHGTHRFLFPFVGPLGKSHQNRHHHGIAMRGKIPKRGQNDQTRTKSIALDELIKPRKDLTATIELSGTNGFFKHADLFGNALKSFSKNLVNDRPKTNRTKNPIISQDKPIVNNDADDSKPETQRYTLKSSLMGKIQNNRNVLAFDHGLGNENKTEFEQPQRTVVVKPVYNKNNNERDNKLIHNGILYRINKIRNIVNGERTDKMDNPVVKSKRSVSKRKDAAVVNENQRKRKSITNTTAAVTKNESVSVSTTPISTSQLNSKPTRNKAGVLVTKKEGVEVEEQNRPVSLSRLNVFTKHESDADHTNSGHLPGHGHKSFHPAVMGLVVIGLVLCIMTTLVCALNHNRSSNTELKRINSRTALYKPHDFY